jgi:(p)ppGpp synthase/HD superfamily hydrolase
MNKILVAKEFARKAHVGQFRKYTGEPYIVHPFRVAAKVLSLPEATEDMVAAAYLHDVIEDCGVTAQQLADSFGPRVADYVVGLTSFSKQCQSKANRAERKKMDLDYLRRQPNEVHIIKMCDRIDNLRDMRQTCDSKDFLEKYLRESKDLYQVLASAHHELALELDYIIHNDIK